MTKLIRTDKTVNLGFQSLHIPSKVSILQCVFTDNVFERSCQIYCMTVNLLLFCFFTFLRANLRKLAICKHCSNPFVESSATLRVARIFSSSC